MRHLGAGAVGLAGMEALTDVKTDGSEVLALFNYDPEETIKVDVAGVSLELKPYETRFVEK